MSMRGAAHPILLPACLALLLGSCTAGEVELYEPEGSGLARGLRVKVELDTAAAEIGEALGWSGGVPGAEVRVHRIGTVFSWQTAPTDSTGVARFPDLIPGTYRLAAYRVLSDEEAALLGGRRRAFGDGRKISISQPRTETLGLAADEPGSLVISELYGTGAYVDETQYDFQRYIELYNNSDTVIYLDGKILGQAWHIDFYSSYLGISCEQSAPFRNDPEGVWAIFFHQFPDSGADYPLAPGGTAVIALDAVDHSRFHPAFPNLSNADFELLGPADVDNPQVPNLADIGVQHYGTGHGFRPSVSNPYFLSERVDVEALPRARYPGGAQTDYVRFPADALLDVLVSEDNDALDEQQFPPCQQSVHRSFDRLEGGFVQGGVDLEYSVQRVVVDYTPDGRAILQDTNTSAVDLIRALYTVGTLPPQD